MHQQPSRGSAGAIRSCPESYRNVVNRAWGQVIDIAGVRCFDEILAGPECTNNPAEEVPEPYDHAQNLTGTLSIELGAKSLILRVYDVLMNDRGFRASDCGASETHEARLPARAETGQTWQPSYSRPTLPTALRSC